MMTREDIQNALRMLAMGRVNHPITEQLVDELHRLIGCADGDLEQMSTASAVALTLPTSPAPVPTSPAPAKAQPTKPDSVAQSAKRKR